MRNKVTRRNLRQAFFLTLAIAGIHTGSSTGANSPKRLLDFQYYWETTAKPLEWKFTKADLAKLLTKISAHENLA